MNCCICNRDRSQGTTLTITEEERRVLAKTALGVVPDSYFYCSPCWTILKDRSQGAQLFKGLIQAGMAKHGVNRADVVAERYYKFLVDRAKKPTS